MSGNPLKHTDFAEEGWISEHAAKELQEFSTDLQIVKIGLQETAKELQKTFNNPIKPDTIASLKAHNLEIKNAKDLSVSYEKVKQAEAETDKKLAQAAAAASVLRKAETQEKKAQIDLDAKINKGKNEEIGAYKKLSQELSANKKAVKDLLASKKELTEADKELILKTQELDKELKEVDSTVGDNQRRVGAYKEMLNDAGAELGAFGGGIGKLIHSMKELHEQNEKATSSTQKLGNVLKLAGATIALVAVMALIKGFELLKEASGQMEEEMEVMNAKFSNFFVTLASGNTNIKESAKLTEEWVVSMQEARSEARQLGLEVAGLTSKLDKQNQIASDSTIGFNERIEAQKEAIKLEDEIAAKQLKRAQTDLRVVENQMNAMRSALQGGKLSNELYEKEAEAIKKVEEAMSKVAILELEDSASVRKLQQEKTDMLIDLTLKSKQNAHERKTILEEELKDNTKYIEERRKINNELFDENKKTISEEVRIFKEGRQTEFDFNKLIIQQDEIKLKNAIDLIRTKQGHGLDAAGVVEIAKIIKQAQENEIANNKIINDLAKEEMKNMEKVADIKRDIATIKLVDELHDSNEVLKMREKAYETSNKNLLDKQNIWDFKMQRIREADFALIGSQLEDSYQLQKKVLTQKEKDAEIKANNTITDTKVLNAEILKLQTQLGIDIGNLETDQFYKEKDLNEKKRLDDKKLWNERLESEMAVMEQINQGIKAGLDKRAQLQQSSDQKEIDMHQRMIDVQARLASEGKANSLAEVEAQTAKAEEKKIQDAKKAAKLQETIAIAETFEKTLTKALESDKPFVQAFSEALASSGLVASTFTALAAGFKDGVEGLNGPGTETSDSIPAMLSKNESVINAKGTKQNPGLATAMNRGTVDEYFESVYLPNYNSSSSAPSIGSGFVHDEKLAYIIDKKFESLQRAIEGKPVPDISLDGLGEWTKKIREGNMTTIIHHLQSQKRPSLRRNG